MSLYENIQYNEITGQEEYSPLDTSLKKIIFFISNGNATADDLAEYREIVQLLLDYGTDPKPAIKLARERYGEYKDPMVGEPEDVYIFKDIIRILIKADKKSKSQ